MYKTIPIQKNNFKNTSSADVLEIWFDRIKESFYGDILKKVKKPIIYKMEEFSGKNLKEEVIKRSQYVDIDISAKTALIKKIKKINPKIKIIMSYHDYKKTPYEKELTGIYGKMLKKGADIVKFATHAKEIGDSFRILDFLSSLGHKNQEAICVCMGAHGHLTRISGHLFGNYMMYFAADEKSKTAPGQITIKEFNELII